MGRDGGGGEIRAMTQTQVKGAGCRKEWEEGFGVGGGGTGGRRGCGGED